MILDIPRKLDDDIKSFCELNEIKEINDFLVSCLLKGFNIARYGEKPINNYKSENKPIEIEKYEERESNTQGVEEKAEKRKGRKPNQEKESEPIKEEEPIKVKKKIRILKD